MIDKDATGGQAGTSSRIENYLGFPKGLSGADLARRATAQAKRFGVEILIPQEAVSLRVDQPYKFYPIRRYRSGMQSPGDCHGGHGAAFGSTRR